MENHLDINSQFIPYNLAVKLKKLGFDEPCIAGYRDYNGIKLMSRINNSTFPIVSEGNIGFGKYCKQNAHVVKAPLWQQTFDWFEDVHGITSCIYMCGKNVWAIEVFKPLAGNGYKWHESSKNNARLCRLEKLIELLINKATTI